MSKLKESTKICTKADHASMDPDKLPRFGVPEVKQDFLLPWSKLNPFSREKNYSWEFLKIICKHNVSIN